MKILYFLCVIFVCGIELDFVNASKDIVLDNNGRYQNIRISVYNNVKKNPMLVEDYIKTALSEFNNVLYSATRQKARTGLSIGKVTISLPASWKGEDDVCQQANAFCPEDANAHFIIRQSDQPNNNNEPHTIQYGKCGEPGKAIIFTPAYFFNVTATERNFGGYGRSMLHHWARFRWGVFREDKTLTGENFYLRTDVDGIGRVFAVTCTENISGKAGVPLPNGSMRRCRRGSGTDRKLPEKSCHFIPDKEGNNATASLMYSTVVKSINMFCDAADDQQTKHNFASPSQHNELCNYRSVMDVIKEHTDFKVSIPKDLIPPSNPDFEIIYREQVLSRTVVLVLDISSSMQGQPLEILKIVASHIVENVIESSVMLGVIAFGSRVINVKPLNMMNSTSIRVEYVNAIRSLRIEGLTALSEGIVSGIECGGCSYDRNLHRVYNCNKTIEIVLLTDGQENTGAIRIHNLIANLANQNVIVHSILFGQASDRRIIQLSQITGGRFVISDPNNPLDDLLREMTSLVKEKMSPFQRVIEVVRENLNFDPAQVTTKSFTINDAVNKNLFLFLTFNRGSHMNLELIGPKNQYINKSDAENYETLVQLNAVRIRMPTTDVQGNWTLRLIPLNTMKYLTDSSELTTVSSSASLYISGLQILHNKNMTSEEATILQGEVIPSTLDVALSNSEVKVIAMLIRNLQLLILQNAVKVFAKVELQTALLANIELRDDGTGGDILAEDGVYSGYIPPSVLTKKGFYAIHVTLQEQDGSKLYRSLSLDTLEVVSNAALLVAPPPGRITDLRAEANTKDGGIVRLQWTAPGAELFSGTVASYELRFSNKAQFEFDDGFQVSPTVWRNSLNFSSAGETQELTFTAKEADLTKAGPLLTTTFCFKLRAFNSKNISSSASNFASAMIGNPVNLNEFVGENPSTLKPTEPNVLVRHNIDAAMIVGICVAVVVVTMAISAALLYFKKYVRHSQIIPVV